MKLDRTRTQCMRKTWSHTHTQKNKETNKTQGLAWMAGGSTRAAFNVSFQRDSNIGDITAKATSQTICSSMVGTAAGVYCCCVFDVGGIAVLYLVVIP